MRFKGEDIKRFIPQRNPMMMVDVLQTQDDGSATTVLAVRPDNMFMLPDGTLAETGLIEHIAQSASALASFTQQTHPQPLPVREGSDYTQGGEGDNSTAEHSTPLPHREGPGVGLPPIGLIGEVKHFTCHRRPQSGDRIETTIVFGFTFGNATIVTGTCRISGEVVAEAKMKIFIQ